MIDLNNAAAVVIKACFSYGTTDQTLQGSHTAAYAETKTLKQSSHPGKESRAARGAADLLWVWC
jgi:hypothetical protein